MCATYRYDFYCIFDHIHCFLIYLAFVNLFSRSMFLPGILQGEGGITPMYLRLRHLHMIRLASSNSQRSLVDPSNHVSPIYGSTEHDCAIKETHADCFKTNFDPKSDLFEAALSSNDQKHTSSNLQRSQDDPSNHASPIYGSTEHNFALKVIPADCSKTNLVHKSDHCKVVLSSHDQKLVSLNSQRSQVDPSSHTSPIYGSTEHDCARKETLAGRSKTNFDQSTVGTPNSNHSSESSSGKPPIIVNLDVAVHNDIKDKNVFKRYVCYFFSTSINLPFSNNSNSYLL